MNRAIPHDPIWKTILVFIHIFSFSLFFGSFVVGAEIPMVERVAVISGFLLMLRELYKGGWLWLTRTDGLVTLLKIVLLIVAAIIPRQKNALLILVVLLGISATHLPDSIRKKFPIKGR